MIIFYGQFFLPNFTHVTCFPQVRKPQRLILKCGVSIEKFSCFFFKLHFYPQISSMMVTIEILCWHLNSAFQKTSLCGFTNRGRAKLIESRFSIIQSFSTSDCCKSHFLVITHVGMTFAGCRSEVLEGSTINQVR